MTDNTTEKEKKQMKRLTKLIGLLAALTLVLSVPVFGGAADDVVTLKWVTVGGGMPQNYDAWAETVNAYLAGKIGVNIDMDVISWGDFENRRSVMISTGADFDIMFTNNSVFNNDVRVGAFLDIGDIIGEAAPELYAMIPEGYWDACKIDGKLYAVPTYKDSSQSEFFIWDTAVAEAAGVDPSQITEIDQLGPALEAIRDYTGEPSLKLHSDGAYHLLYMYDLMGAGLYTMGVRYDDETATVVNPFEQDDIKGYLALLREWYLDGIINSDAAVTPESQSYYPFGIAQGWAGAAKTTWGPQLGVDVVAYQWGPTIVSNQTVQGSMNAVSVNCEHPEKALAFLQLINTDSYLRDSFYYGLEGDDWDYTADGLVHRNKTDWTMAGYTQGSFFNVTQTDDVDFNQWDEVKELNEKAVPSVLLGFTMDTEPVEDQLLNCTFIFSRYMGELLTGTTDPTSTVEAMMEEMDAAGYAELVTEAQAQVDAFMASK